MKPSFTLLEIVFVIIIIGILAVVALPKFSSSINSAEKSKIKSTFFRIQSAISTKYNKNVISGSDSCPDLEKSTSDNTLFENVLSSPINKNQGQIKWDGDGIDYNASTENFVIKFKYYNTPEDNCQFKCVSNCDLIK